MRRGFAGLVSGAAWLKDENTRKRVLTPSLPYLAVKAFTIRLIPRRCQRK